jgi:hypothetical protein
VCNGGGSDAPLFGEHLAAVQVGKATRREVNPRGPGFPGASVGATSSKTATSGVWLTKPNVGGTTSDRTDATSATTKDGFVCRHGRDVRGVHPILGATSRSLVG